LTNISDNDLITYSKVIISISQSISSDKGFALSLLSNEGPKFLEFFADGYSGLLSIYFITLNREDKKLSFTVDSGTEFCVPLEIFDQILNY